MSNNRGNRRRRRKQVTLGKSRKSKRRRKSANEPSTSASAAPPPHPHLLHLQEGPPLPDIGYRQWHKLRLYQTNRLKDWLLLEEEFLKNVQRQLNELAERRAAAAAEAAADRQDANVAQSKSTNQTLMPAAFQLARLTTSRLANLRIRPADTTAEEDLTLDLIRGSPMVVAKLEQIIDEDHAVVTLEDGSEWYLPILSIVDRERLHPDSRILLRPDLEAIVGVVSDDLLIESAARAMKITLKPDVSFEQIGGLDSQIQELREVIELPLTQPELYEAIGISPPKGVLLYGPPGTGKTMLAKAVAHCTQAAFFYTSASKLVQKTLGDGPRIVRELFKLANQNSPSIVFIDEIDAIGNKRSDMERNEDREIQRTMLELLNQLDGFDSMREVKVILATNRIDLLDPALIRAGRIDRKIAIPTPNWNGALHIFRLHTAGMRLADDVNAKEILPPELFSNAMEVDQRMRPSHDDHCQNKSTNQSTVNDRQHTSVRPIDLLGDDWPQQLTGADIIEICNHAGLLALRDRALRVGQQHFVAARRLLLKKQQNVNNSMFI